MGAGSWGGGLRAEGPGTWAGERSWGAGAKSHAKKPGVGELLCSMGSSTGIEMGRVLTQPPSPHLDPQLPNRPTPNSGFLASQLPNLPAPQLSNRPTTPQLSASWHQLPNQLLTPSSPQFRSSSALRSPAQLLSSPTPLPNFSPSASPAPQTAQLLTPGFLASQLPNLPAPQLSNRPTTPQLSASWHQLPNQLLTPSSPQFRSSSATPLPSQAPWLLSSPTPLPNSSPSRSPALRIPSSSTGNLLWEGDATHEASSTLLPAP